VPDWKSLVNWQSHAELVTSALQAATDAGAVVTNFNHGGPFKTLAEVTLQGVADIWDTLVERLLPASFLRWASGVWLELFADDYCDGKLLARHTLGLVRFGRVGTAGNVSIGTTVIVTTEVGGSGAKLRYFVREATVLPDGSSFVFVPVRAEFKGSAYNVVPGAIKLLETPVSGVETVANEADWITTEGRDDEEDDALRERMRLKWPGLSRGATADAYRSWALQAGASSVQVDDKAPRGPGTVDVIITGPAGAPSAELITTVQAFIDARRPQCSDARVMGPELVEVEVAGTLELDPDEGDEASAQGAIDERLQAWFYGSVALGVPARRPGDDAAVGQLHKLMMGVDGAYDLVLTAPAATVLLTSRQLAVPGDLDVTAAVRGSR